MRLVIYEGPWRHASALHNEKAICAIGRNMVTTGHLDEEGIEYALETLARFRALCDGYGVKDVDAVATAAARDATNGKEFVARRGEGAGRSRSAFSPARTKRKIAAEGVLAGIPDADGLVADLGGGSLDMVTVKDGKTGAAATLPFGPLRLMDLSGGNLNKARNAVEKGLDKLDFASGLKGKALYAVGGIWRALAHVDMEQQAYPLHVLHHYVIPAKRARPVVPRRRRALGASRSRRCTSVPKRRAEALPYGALVMEEMIHAFGSEGGGGLRLRSARGRAAAQASARRGGQGSADRIRARAERRAKRARPAHAVELFDWMTPLFPKETTTNAASAKRRASSPISAGAAIPTTARWARSRRCCAAPMAAPIITSAP